MEQPGFNGKPFFECQKRWKVKANGNCLDPKHPWKMKGFKPPIYIYIYIWVITPGNVGFFMVDDDAKKGIILQ